MILSLLFQYQLFRAHSRYIHHETFFMMSLLAISFGNRFCFSRKGRIGRGGWVHQNSMAASGLVSRSDLVGTGRLFLSFLV